LNILHHPCRVLPQIFVIASMTVAMGCNLTEYEARMDRAQRRLNYLDQQKTFVAAGSITLDQEMTKPGNSKYKWLTTIGFSYKPPKGIALVPASLLQEVLLVYPKNLDAKFEKVLVGAVNVSSEQERASYQAEVLQALNVQDVRDRSKELGQQVDDLQRFKWFHDETPGSPYVYFHKNGNTVTAIAFYPRPGMQDIDKAMDFSLATLRVTAIAGSLGAQSQPTLLAPTPTKDSAPHK